MKMAVSGSGFSLIRFCFQPIFALVSKLRTWLPKASRRPPVFVSLVVALRNEEQYLSGFFANVTGQSSAHFEIVLVDDCSEDRSLELCQEFASRYPRVVVTSTRGQGPRGAAAARKKGFEASSGDYVIFLDADDFIQPKLVETVQSAVKKSRPDVVAWGFIIQEHPPHAPLFDYGVNWSLVEPKKYQTEKLAPNLFQTTNPAMWNKALKRSLVEEVLSAFSPELRWANDLPVTYTALAASQTILFIQENLTIYMVRPGRLSSIRQQYPEDIFRSLELLASEISSRKLEKRLGPTLKGLFSEQLLFHLSAVDRCVGEELIGNLPELAGKIGVGFSEPELENLSQLAWQSTPTLDSD